MRVVVEVLDADALACGIQTASVESLTALTLRNNGVRPVMPPGRASPFIYVRPVVIRGGSVCIVSLTISVRDDGGSHSVGGVKRSDGFHVLVLCEASALFTGTTATLAFTNRLEEQIKLCLGKLDY
jgi:hypothetical protein